MERIGLAQISLIEKLSIEDRGCKSVNVNLKQRFQEILEDNRILEAELMSRHTTFRIGGPADFFLVPENADEIKKIIAVCKEKNVPYFILGNGAIFL